jgi:prepilin-type N-terminal cleavage/methylation domain-containing protein
MMTAGNSKRCFLRAGAAFRLLGWKNKDCQQGFTIMEVVVAVIVLALAYTSILQNFSLSLRNIKRIDDKLAQFFSGQLQFESKLEEMALGGEVEQEGEVFLEGEKYRLVVVGNENGDFFTLFTEAKY